MGVAITSTINTDIGMSSPDSVSISTVVTSNFLDVEDVVPKDATAMST